MLVGDPQQFAIESGISKAYASLSLRALGFFVIHVGGRRYGVYEPDATMLANSLDGVVLRLKHRGLHIAPFATELNGGGIADAYRNALSADEEKHEFLGIRFDDFPRFFLSNNLAWAPDGDEAFDDGSYVLQFDVDNNVRIIALRSTANYLHDPATLSDIWLDAETYYSVLEQWHRAFESESLQPSY